MRRSATLATAVVAALALAVPTAATAATHPATRPGLTGVASAARPGLPGVVTAVQAARTADMQAAKPRRKKKASARRIEVTRSAARVAPGVAGALEVTALVRGRGKVTFSIGGVRVGKVRIRKGRAVLAVPALATGDYRLTARFGKRRGSTTFRVHASVLQLSALTFTLSKRADPERLPTLTGTVTYQDAAPGRGLVDVYTLGSGPGSGNGVEFADVGPGGTFDFADPGYSSNVFLERLLYDPAYVAGGTYQFQAFYVPDSDDPEVVASSPITVTVTP